MPINHLNQDEVLIRSHAPFLILVSWQSLLIGVFRILPSEYRNLHN